MLELAFDDVGLAGRLVNRRRAMTRRTLIGRCLQIIGEGTLTHGLILGALAGFLGGRFGAPKLHTLADGYAARRA